MKQMQNTSSDNFAGIWVEGHPRAKEYSGLYRRSWMHKGHPVYSHDKNNRVCYRYEARDAQDRWRFGTTHKPDRDSCAAKIVSPTGPLPTGAREWKCWNATGKSWNACTIRITGMVRNFPSSERKLN